MARALVRRGAVIVAVLAVLGAAYGGYVVRESHQQLSLPGPRGPWPVGRTEVTWADATRTDPWSPNGGPRRLSTWIWYPASAGGRSATYAPGAWSHLHLGWPVGLAETAFADISVPVRQDAPIAAGPFPVVVLEPGLGLAAPQYQVLGDELASEGYLVAMVTPTYSANTTVLDGRPVASNQSGNPSAFTGQRTASGDRTAAALLAVWTADLRATAALLTRMARVGRFAGHLDTATVVYGGHSFGGAAALEACGQDPRCHGAFDLDGGEYGTAVADGLRVPLLLIGHDGSCITSHCHPANGEDRQDRSVAASVVARSTGGVWMVTVRATGHFNFSDYGVYYLAAPLRRLLALGGIDGVHGLALTTGVVVDFLRTTTTGRRSGVLGDGAPIPAGLTVDYRLGHQTGAVRKASARSAAVPIRGRSVARAKQTNRGTHSGRYLALER